MHINFNVLAKLFFNVLAKFNTKIIFVITFIGKIKVFNKLGFLNYVR